MERIVERYIYDVTRRLPEKERAEVGREVEACIADMLPDEPCEQDYIDVLTKLGEPGLLAEKYRQNPRYLISPSVFELYISVMKTVVLITAGIFACVGLLTAATPVSAGEVIASVVSAGCSGALQAACWVTLGFAIGERFKAGAKQWTVNDLPQLADGPGAKIPRSSSITGIILSVFFTAWFITIVSRDGWLFVFATDFIMPFSQSALKRSIPYILLLGGINLLINSLKLFWGRWNIPLCIANIAANVTWVGIAMHILRWKDLLSGEFTAFIGPFLNGHQHILPGGMAVFFSAVFIIVALVDIGESVWKTRKGTVK